MQPVTSAVHFLLYRSTHWGCSAVGCCHIEGTISDRMATSIPTAEEGKGHNKKTILDTSKFCLLLDTKQSRN
ncbi:hypothetical protein TSUD_330140 [Trifolium subterraneum]|nr:hypothetical protein TSUD_330140 [Trifolium subterraneum]